MLYPMEYSNLVDKVFEAMSWAWIGKPKETDKYGWIPYSMTNFLNTTSGNKTITATPTNGDLIVLLSEISHNPHGEN